MMCVDEDSETILPRTVRVALVITLPISLVAMQQYSPLSEIVTCDSYTIKE